MWKLIFAWIVLHSNFYSSSSDDLQLDNLRYNDCGRYACSENGKFKFSSDTMYQYLYTLTINSTFDKNLTKNSGLRLKFNVDVRIENCEGVMKIDRHIKKEGFSVFEEDPFDHIYEEVHQYSLRFSFYDGSILNVCPNRDESISSLNIKKGILSAFQNRMKRFDIDKFTSEKDINGLCPTTYNLERINGTTLVIRKIKDIANCLERYQLHSIIPTSRYVFQSRFQKWAPLNSTLECHQTIDHNIPTYILCYEEHSLKFLHNNTYTARTLIRQEFELLAETNKFTNFFNFLQYPDEIPLRDDLTFNHKKPKKSEITELEESEELLLQLCNVTSEEFQLDAAGIFTKFIHTARHLSYDALDMLLEKSNDICSTGRKHVQDSLPFLRSTAAVSLMKEIIMNGNISETTANGWLFAISLFSRPNAEVINSVTPLIRQNDTSNNILLSITSVIHSYGLWASENDDKETKETIITTVTFLENILNDTLHFNYSRDKTIVLLRSLGNAGVLTNTLRYTLSSCISNYLFPTEVRIAAIEAHRRLPCDFNVETLLDVYKNVDYEAEIRISAYLQLMNCPSYDTIKTIKWFLENEKVNQVGTFVWSHIQNVMKSSLKYRLEIQSILQDYTLQKKFKTDFRKYSRNYEASFYLSDYGIGGNVISNVIFSTKTYIPTYITFNITINVLGEIINVLEMNIFIEGFETYIEKYFKGGSFSFIEKLVTQISSFRFIRSIPTTIKEKIKSLAESFFMKFPEPSLSISAKIFGNEIRYTSYRGRNGIDKLINCFDINHILNEFLNGQEIKFDYSTVFMDLSYVSPTAAGVPLSLDAVGISITNFDSAILINVSNFDTTHQMMVSGKLKPKFSVNFEGTMGTDLVYQQTQVQIKSEVYTSSEVEGYFAMDGYDNVTLSFNLPLKKFDIFSFESDFYYKNNEINENLVLEDTSSLSSSEVSCFWPLLDQALGLKVCSTYYIQDPSTMLESLMDTLRKPFKFSLFMEKSDPSAKIYTFKYNKNSIKNNESMIMVEFETPGSERPRSMKTLFFISPENNTLSITVHANKSVVLANGLYKNTQNDKILNFDMSINGKRHVDLILELHKTHDKKTIIYTPKLYFAITSKPVAELSGTYKWVEKKGTSQCDIDIQFKTNKFDSYVTGYVILTERTISTNIHIRYKFERSKNESLNFEFKYNDRSTKLATAMTGNFQLESTAYPEINMGIFIKYHIAHDRIDVRLDYVSSPFEENDSKKLNFQCALSYYKSFNGVKLNTFFELRKQITDVNIKVGLSHQNTPVSSSTVVLVRYAKDKNIMVKIDTYSPQLPQFHYELKLNTTLPSVQQPMIVHVRILEKNEKEYDLDFSGTWFSGHTAMAKGVFQDKSNHYVSAYFLKLLVKSRLFNELLISVKVSLDEHDQKITALADYESTRYEFMLTHAVNVEDQHETYIEYKYNSTGVYSLNNHLDIPKKELTLELHLDKYRDIHMAARGTLEKWNSDVGVELKWDVNRDPSQKIKLHFKTMSTMLPQTSEYTARFLFEYPGHISVASINTQYRGGYRSLSIILEMNPTSVIEVIAYNENEFFTKGFARLGFKLVTPFENWKESSLFYGVYTEKQSFRTNGSLVWQSDQNIIFDSRGGYAFENDITSLTLSSSLNSTLQELASLAFSLNYTRVQNEIHVSFLLQPNIKYSLFLSVSGMVKYYDKTTEYTIIILTRTPFLEFVRTKFIGRLRSLTDSRIKGDIAVYLNDDLYALYIKGILNPFEKTKLCLRMLTPFEKYHDISGLLSYDPDAKHVYLNLTGRHVNVKSEIVYVYNNLSNFHLRLEVKTPLSYVNNLAVVGMYSDNSIEVRIGWNAFHLGFASITYFNSWEDLEYGVQLYTPMTSFKQSSAIFKILLVPDKKLITSRIIIYNLTKVGIHFEYDSEKSQITYLDECDNFYDKDTPGVYKSKVLHNGLLELDSLIYPTVIGKYHLRQSGNRYTFDAKAAVFFFKVDISDQLEYENSLSFNNSFKISSSIDMLSQILNNVMIKRINDSITRINADLELVTFNQHQSGSVDIFYEYNPIDGSLTQIKNKIDGIHNVNLRVKTPFELLEYGEITVVTTVQNYVFETVVNVVTDHTNISLLGNLQYSENFFNLNTSFNMSSNYMVVPGFQLQILRDFSKLEKQIVFTLREPTPEGDNYTDMFSLRSMWYIDNRNYITLAGELRSPFKILDELRASLHYSHEIGTEMYYLEAYMKYSNKTEMKARANLKPPNVTLNLESSMEGLKNAHFIGTLERIAAGQQKIDAVMLTNNNFRIQGSSSVTDMTPFAIKGRLLKGKEGIEISSVEMHVKKKEGGYNVLASLFSKGKTLNVETEITDYSNNIRIINLAIKTGKGNVESLQVNAELKLQHPGIYVLTIKGDSAIENIKGSSITKMEIWFRNGIGALFASLDSTTIKGKAEIFTIWKPPDQIYGMSKIHFLLDKKFTEILNMKMYFMRFAESYDNFTSGLMVHLNEKWMMEANMTISNSTYDKKIESHIILPNGNRYTLIGGFKYTENYDWLQHIVSYSKSKEPMCFTLGDINLMGEDVQGVFAFKCGMKDKLFMTDKFSGKRTMTTLVITNALRSNTLANTLITHINYKKPKDYHIVNLKFEYPPKQQIAMANVNFESTSNFDCFVNTTTPFAYMPHFACEIISETTPYLYRRCGKVYLHERFAFFNITHVVKNLPTKNKLQDGKITIAFPIATWHEGVMIYKYEEDTSSRTVGSSDIFYNKERIIDANFTKNSTSTRQYDKYFTYLAIGNRFVPIGVNYMRQMNHKNSLQSIMDLKRVELYKLSNSSSFNVTGEILTESSHLQEWTTIRMHNFNRTLIVKSRTDSGNPYETSAFIKLKPELWLQYNLKTNRITTGSNYQKLFDLNVAYPRRNFSVTSDFGYGENYLISQIIVRNFLVTPYKSVGLIFQSRKPLSYLRETNLILFHPSFIRNVTIFASFYSASSILANMKLNVEYSTNANRALQLSAIIENKSKNSNRNYTLNLKGQHPATRFQLDVSGALKSETGIHFIGNNISYHRSYLPNQYWRGKAYLNTIENILDVERISTRALIILHGDHKKYDSKHVINSLIIEGTTTNMSGNIELDLDNKYVNAVMNLTADSTDRLQIEGNVKDNRKAKFNIWRTYNDFNFPQMTSYLALNHSRFLSSVLFWRTDMGTNILKVIRSTISYSWVSAQEAVEFWTQFLRSETSETLTAVWNDAKPELSEFLDDFGNIKSVQDNINYFKSVLNDSYNANEFFLHDIHDFYILMSQEISFMDKLENLPKIINEIVESMGETSEIIKKSLVWVVNTIKEFYEEVLRILDDLVEGKAEMYAAKFIKKGTEKFDKFIKDLHISFISSTEAAINELLSVLTHYRDKIMTIFEPTFIEIVHHVETTIWSGTKKLMDFLYAKKNDLMNSPHFLRNANVTQRLDAIYKDFTKNDLITNIKKYVGLLFNTIYEYYISQIPYREELTSIGNEIIDEIMELYKLPLIEYTVENIKLMYNQVVWLYDYLDITTRIQKIVPFLYRQYQENSYTALEIELKNHKPKTKFIFIPENGVVKIEQKLPFPWHAFNETPIYEELEEYKYMKRIQSLFSTAKLKIWSFYSAALTLLDPKTWFPPFNGYAQIIGFNNYITFDSVHVPFKGNMCRYLLSHDFMDEQFSLVLSSNENRAPNQQSILILIGGETISIQFEPIRIKIDSRKTTKFPVQLNNTYIYFENSIITVRNQNGVTLECNVHYRICSIKLTGWFFGKVSGLLGTMNNEQSDDVRTNNDRYGSKKEYYLWSLNQEQNTCPATTTTSMMPPDYGVNEKCNQLFLNSTSPFEPCFSEVDPSTYYSVCVTHLENSHVCSTAMSYVQSCLMNSVPLRIPAVCVSCLTGNNQYDSEGSFHHLEGDNILQSTDVIFIVEAKECNKDLLTKRNIQLLVNTLSKELSNNGLDRNRYALVIFGGDHIYNTPHSVVLNGNVFANSSTFPKYFETFPSGNGNSDIFDALRFATKLSIRMGVSKTFILIPCSNCNPLNMTLDYSVLHHALTEKSIRLHILMNEDFPPDKLKSGKVIFGIDSKTAYTKDDSENLRGNVELYRQMKLTKSLLGYCTPLALETNGTLFAAKLLASSPNVAIKFINTFAKRVAQSAKPDDCQECECHSDKNGIPYIECISCSFPTPANFEFENDEEIDFPAFLNLVESKSSREKDD